MTAIYNYSLKGKRVWIAGHRGMVGSAIARRLAHEEIDLINLPHRSIDLRDQSATTLWIKEHKPHVIFLAAAKVGGIAANKASPVDFLYDNMMIAANIMHAAHQIGVEKLVFLGSTCIYPKQSPQPIPEHSLMSGPLEPTNEFYAIAKIAGLKLAQAYRRQYGLDFISCQPTNLYGPGDNYDLETSHVLPALLRKAHEAKMQQLPTLTIWGSGKPRREFLHVEDLADAIVFLCKHYSSEDPINIGSGEEVTIAELAQLICQIVEFPGELIFDPSRPDGTPRKLADTSRIKALGWDAARPLSKGINATYHDWLHSIDTISNLQTHA